MIREIKVLKKIINQKLESAIDKLLNDIARLQHISYNSRIRKDHS